jgi:hypothetical protein
MLASLVEHLTTTQIKETQAHQIQRQIRLKPMVNTIKKFCGDECFLCTYA